MTEEWLKFSEKETWILLVALGVFLLFFIKEWVRTNRKNRLVRILCSAIAVIALLMVWMKPQNRSTSKSSTVLFLTDDYSQEQIDTLDKEYGFSRIVHFDSLSYYEKKELLNQNSALLVGEGIATNEIKLWKDFNIKYIDVQSREKGFSKIRYDKIPSVGETLEVQGEIEVSKPGWLKLRLLDKTIDSIEVSPDKSLFTLNSELKTAGKFIYQLSFANENTAFENSLPVVIREAPVYNILMINAYPTFEVKYLKNYLAEAGHAVSVRNQITRGRYKFEFFNAKTKQFYRLNESLLLQYDLFIIDRETLSSLSRTELNALQNAIENGLGIFVMPDEVLFKKEVPLLNFRFQPQADDKATIILLEQEMALDSYGYTIEDQFGLSFTIDQVVAHKRLGLGKMATTSIQNTFNLLLKGEEKAYEYLWREQLEAVARQPKQMKLTYDWPAILDHPVNFRISGVRDIESFNVGDNRLSPIQDMHIPTNWSVTFWPKETGWHKVHVNQDSAWVYVNDKTEWSLLRQIEQRKANNRAFTTLQNNDQTTHYWQPIKPLWFYLLFLLSVGYLWLEPKLS